MPGVDLARWLLLGIGTLFVLVAVYDVWDTRRFAAQAMVAEGRVVNLRELEAGKDGQSMEERRRLGPMFVPVIEFRLADGRMQQFEPKVRQRPLRYGIQDRVRVLYPPADPGAARIDSVVQRWLLALIFGGVGLVLLLFGAGLWLLVRSP